MWPVTRVFYFACAGMVYKLQGFSIKFFYDFEIEIDFDRGTILKINVFFFCRAVDLPEPGAGGYTSRSRGGVSAENSDKNKKALF